MPKRAPLFKSKVAKIVKEKAVARYSKESSKRYNNKEWRKFRALKLQESPYCVECFANGILNDQHLEIDHIKPVTGIEDPTFYDLNATQTLCKACHSRKTMRESKDKV